MFGDANTRKAEWHLLSTHAELNTTAAGLVQCVVVSGERSDPGQLG